MDREKAERRIRIKKHLPKALRNRLNGATDGDTYNEAIVDLYYQSEDIRDLFGSYYISKFSRAFHDVNSKEDAKNMILGEILQNRDPYHLWDRDSWPGEASEAIYKTLISIIELKLVDQLKQPFIDKIRHFDEAALEIMLDQCEFFTKNPSGNEGTISEYVGNLIGFDYLSEKSPFVQDGVYEEQVRDKIRYEDIIEGKLSDKQAISHQRSLLYLLYRVATKETKSNREFWYALEANPDFFYVGYNIALEEGDSHADELLPKIFDEIREEAEPDRFDWDMDRMIRNHFHDQTAFDKFMDEADEKYGKYLNLRGVESPKEYIVHFGEFTVLLGYEREGSKVKVNYAQMKGILQRGTAELDMDSGQTEGIPQVRMDLINLVQDTERFKKEYSAKAGLGKPKN